MDSPQVSENFPSPSTNNCSNGANGSISRSDLDTNNAFPTTYVQADTSIFKQVVQILTGSPNSSASRGASGGGGIPPIKSTGQKKQGFKLYERRNSLKNGVLMINTLNSCAGCSPELLSPSILDFPSLVLSSPVAPLNEDDSKNLTHSVEEDKAIAEKKFYFHPPSPRTNADPQLLPLFPVTSPRISEYSA